jgi:hypothetical protein
MIQKLVYYKRFGIGLFKATLFKALSFGEGWVRLLLQKVVIRRMDEYTFFNLNCLFN